MATSKLPANVGAPELAQALASRPEIRLLDVRTPAEFARAHIEGSYNVPLGELEPHAATIGRTRAPVVLVCRSGARAQTAQEVLRRAGARSVHVLDGGMIAWRRGGLPVDGRPRSAGDLLRRVAGVAGLVLAALTARENPLVALMLGVVGVRLVFGQSVLPCAAAGTCAVAGPDTASTVRDLVAGTPAGAAGATADRMELAGG